MTLRGARGIDLAEASDEATSSLRDVTPSANFVGARSADDELPRLDKYDVQEEIGHGGMATVYRAIDPALGREVAVKVIHRHLRDNGEVAQRFVAEARAAAKLKHRGIVGVYDVSRDEDRERYLVAELIRGCTLRKVLVDNRDIPPEIGAAIAAELCDAVEHAHEAGLIHRDIKPENVLVERPQDRARPATHTPTSVRRSAGRSADRAEGASSSPRSSTRPRDEDDDELASSAPRVVARATPTDTVPPVSQEPNSGRPSDPTSAGKGQPQSSKPGGGRVVIKLTDFGIAKTLDAQSVTSTGQVLGSPAHMAPEQIEGGEVDARTDVFALGVLLYECLVGHLPFEGKNPAQVLRRVIEGSFAPADSERPTVGNRFASIVAAALATDPNDRPRSAADLGKELRRELAELGLDSASDEINAYFADPEGYSDALSARVVPKLIARGEAARKTRNVPLAAGDFNRAHALSPRDPTILKRITQLSSARGRRILVRRLAIVVGAAAVLGVSAFGVVRLVRHQSAELAAGSAQSREGNAADVRIHPVVPDDPETSAVPRVRPSAITSALLGKPLVPLRPVTSADLADALLVDGPRTVRFAPNPPGARLVVDGVPRAFNTEDQLAPGPHTFTISPAAPDDCCEEVAGSLTVPKAKRDKPNDTFHFTVSLKFRPAHVSIAGIPAGGTATCNGYAVGATPVGIKTTSADPFQVTCTFASEKGTAKGSGRAKAGGSSQIQWVPP